MVLGMKYWFLSYYFNYSHLTELLLLGLQSPKTELDRIAESWKVSLSKAASGTDIKTYFAVKAFIDIILRWRDH